MWQRLEGGWGRAEGPDAPLRRKRKASEGRDDSEWSTRTVLFLYMLSASGLWSVQGGLPLLTSPSLPAGTWAPRAGSWCSGC